MHTHICVCTHSHTHAHTHTHTMQVRIYLLMHVRLHKHTCMYVIYITHTEVKIAGGNKHGKRQQTDRQDKKNDTIKQEASKTSRMC